MKHSDIDLNHHVVVLLGEELLVKRDLERWIKAILPEGRDQTNFMTYDMPEDDPQQISDEAMMVSLFSSTKVIVVHGIERANMNLFEELLPVAKNPSSAVYVFLIGSEYPKGTAVTNFKKALKKTGLEHKFLKKDFDGFQFVRQRAQELNASIEADAIGQLVADCGSPSILENELLKLVAFVEDGKSITIADVSEICEVTSEMDRWELTNAIIQRDVRKALSCLHRMFKEEQEPHAIFGMVAYQVRQLTILQEHLSQGTTLGNTWKYAPTRNSVMKVLKQHPIHASKVLKQMLWANRCFNSSKADAKNHLHALIISLCLE